MVISKQKYNSLVDTNKEQYKLISELKMNIATLVEIVKELKDVVEEDHSIVEKLNTIHGVEILKQSTHTKQSTEDLWINGIKEK